MQRFHCRLCAVRGRADGCPRQNRPRGRVDPPRREPRAGAQLVVLPETCTTGFTPNVGPEALWDLVDVLPGAQVGAAAAGRRRSLGIYLVFPPMSAGVSAGWCTTPPRCSGRTADLLGVYRKTHLFPTERVANRGWSTAGARRVCIHTPLASIGLTICYDGDFPELYRAEASWARRSSAGPARCYVRSKSGS
jgi:deaminated glutathione amidase